MELNKLAELIHTRAKEKGFYDNEFNFQSRLMDIVSELAEANEDYRNHKCFNEIWYENNKPCGIPTEIADAIIRLLDLAGYLEIDLDFIVDQKLEYNLTRPYKHGKAS